MRKADFLLSRKRRAISSPVSCLSAVYSEFWCSGAFGASCPVVSVTNHPGCIAVLFHISFGDLRVIDRS